MDSGDWILVVVKFRTISLQTMKLSMNKIYRRELVNVSHLWTKVTAMSASGFNHIFHQLELINHPVG